MVSETLLIGFALGSIPSAELARLFVALIAKKFGLKPAEIRRYNNTDANESDGDTDTAE